MEMMISHDQSSTSCGKVLVVVGSIVVCGVLTCCALLQSVYDLKATQMNI